MLRTTHLPKCEGFSLKNYSASISTCKHKRTPTVVTCFRDHHTFYNLARFVRLSTIQIHLYPNIDNITYFFSPSKSRNDSNVGGAFIFLVLFAFLWFYCYLPLL